MTTKELIKEAILKIKGQPKRTPLTHAEQIKLERDYWNEILEEATKEETIGLAQSMLIFTHLDNGRQRALKQIKSEIVFDKIEGFRKALRGNK